MLEAKPLWELALQSGRAAFLARHRSWYLLKHADRGIATPPEPIVYDTMALPEGESEITDPYQGEWRYVEVVKRPGNPFPERIGVGRATNCDVVLRLPFVSKLHAHFLDGIGPNLRLADNRSVNGTFFGDRPLVAGEVVDVYSGDWVGFGALRLQLVDGRDLYDELMHAFGPPPS